jgi:mannose-6-phosphate isomerase-like protein (cupin superfamily)
MEDVDGFKKELWEPIGSKIIQYLRPALQESELVRSGLYKREWLDVDDQSFDWAMFLVSTSRRCELTLVSLILHSPYQGAAGTSTAMHFDTDQFGFLYVVEGRKRVVVLENTGLVNETRFNITSFFHGSAWTDLDILKTEHQPEGTLVFEVGPGEGIVIPSRAWHAVENLEPTLAYSIRIE